MLVYDFMALIKKIQKYLWCRDKSGIQTIGGEGARVCIQDLYIHKTKFYQLEQQLGSKKYKIT